MTQHPNLTSTSTAIPGSPASVVKGNDRRYRQRLPSLGRGLLRRLFAGLLGVGLLLVSWQLIALHSTDFPSPWQTVESAIPIFAHPFYVAGPNDQGIGWNVLASLQRVAMGFCLATAIGIPIGFLIGRYRFAADMLNPVIALLRPVSPLAWLPIGLLIFQRADPASYWTIFICSVWPLILNTAEGVRQIPDDYLNVAKVLRLSELTVIRKIIFPAALPNILTGMRLSIGIAWLVIVAAEMLTGGMGIGFWIWNEWNNLNMRHIIIAIFVIGIVGLLLEKLLMAIARRFSFEKR